MNKQFEQKTDKTKKAYLEAFTRLKSGTQEHPELKGKDIKINATTISLEAGKSRNPLYHKHKDILDMIDEVKNDKKSSEEKSKEKSEIETLKEKIRFLEKENKKLMNVNAMLLFSNQKTEKND